MLGLRDPTVVQLLRSVRERPTFPVYQGVESQLARLDGVAEFLAPRTVRIAVLSSFTVDAIKPYLRVGCLERGVWAEVFVAGFNQFAQEILKPGSPLYTFSPDVCFLHVLPEALVPGEWGTRVTPGQTAPLVAAVQELAETFRRHSRADFIVANFAAPSRFPYALQADGMAQTFRLLNEELAQLAREHAGLYILDYERLTAYHGKGSVADERLRHIARMELGDRFLPKLANQMLAYVLALRGFTRKVIVLDLDNILWGGVIGEDGLEGIQVGADYPGSAFVEFQRSLATLREQGILLTINSKNNEADALEVLVKHPAMVLRPEHFSAMRINWRDKCENLESIAEELGVGLDTFIFIDDSPAERELIRSQRPEVLTPEWSPDPVDYRVLLESLPDFGMVSITEEDRRRSSMYATEQKRQALRERGGSFEDYLFRLRMEAWIHEAKPTELARVQQLIQKTNQFNLTTRRYAASEIEAFLRGPGSAIYVLHNRDAFGDNGLVGVAILVQEPAVPTGIPTWRIDTLLMSCRLLGRTIEAAFLGYLLSALKARGCRRAIGEFIATSKNALVRDFYAQAGFQLVESRDGASVWAVDLSAYMPPALPWIAINPAASPTARAIDREVAAQPTS